MLDDVLDFLREPRMVRSGTPVSLRALPIPFPQRDLHLPSLPPGSRRSA